MAGSAAPPGPSACLRRRILKLRTHPPVLLGGGGSGQSLPCRLLIRFDVDDPVVRSHRDKGRRGRLRWTGRNGTLPVFGGPEAVCTSRREGPKGCFGTPDERPRRCVGLTRCFASFKSCPERDAPLATFLGDAVAMNRMIAGLAILLTAGLSASEAFPRGELRCSIWFTPGTRDRTTTVLLASATGDTVLAGPGEVSPSVHGGHLGSGAPGPIYAQVVQVEQFGGGDSERLGDALRQPGSAHALVVPWDYDPGCAAARWTRGFAWMEPGALGTLTLRLRPDSMWVNGLPVFDAFMAVLEPYPAAFEGSDRAPAASGDAPWLTPEQYFRLLIAMPPREEWTERPDSSWSVASAWQSANPELAERYPATVIASQMASSATRAKAQRALRSIAPPITGTYRMTLVLNDGPARTFYMRTRVHPMSEWLPIDTPREPVHPVDEPARPDAYNMLASVAPSVGELPPNCVDARDVSRDGYVYVIDPPVRDGERQTAWSGWLEVSLLTKLFRSDTDLEAFRLQESTEWGTRWRASTELEAPARFWDDGGVLRVEQTTRLQDGRTLEVRGERTSGAAIACDW